MKTTDERSGLLLDTPVELTHRVLVHVEMEDAPLLSPFVAVRN